MPCRKTYHTNLCSRQYQPAQRIEAILFGSCLPKPYTGMPFVGGHWVTMSLCQPPIVVASSKISFGDRDLQGISCMSIASCHLSPTVVRKRWKPLHATLLPSTGPWVDVSQLQLQVGYTFCMVSNEGALEVVDPMYRFLQRIDGRQCSR